MKFTKSNLGVPVTLSFKMFQRTISLSQLLKFSSGKIAIKQFVGEEIDICIGESIIAKGQIYLNNGNCNIKITKIL